MVGLGRNNLLDLFSGLQNGFCLLNDLFANRRDVYVAAVPLKKSCAQLFFEFANGDTESRLTDEARFRSLTKMSGTGNCNDIFEFG